MKLLQAALLFLLFLATGCQSINENLLGSSQNNETEVEQQLDGYTAF